MSESTGTAAFEQEFLPHLEAAYNLARWFTRNQQDAQDVVQESYLRAIRFFPSYRGGNARAWLLTIVRNTSFTWLQQNRARQLDAEFDEQIFGPDTRSPNPEESLLRDECGNRVHQALQSLPPVHREVIVLRELLGMSYSEISVVIGAPIGSVMSRLFRARNSLREFLAPLPHNESALGAAPAR
jgi:RNA polymerase sigma-70 factor, ECF subfamily